MKPSGPPGFDVLLDTPLIGVGQDSEDEAALPFVARAHFRRCDESRRNSVANSLEVSDGSVESIRVRNESCDVLAEEQSRTKRRDDSQNLGPHITRIIGAAALPGRAVGWAGPTRNDAIHDASERLAVEGGEVTPDRRLIQETVCHRLNQSRGSEGFPLHVTDRASIAHGESEPEVESAAAGAEAEGM